MSIDTSDRSTNARTHSLPNSSRSRLTTTASSRFDARVPDGNRDRTAVRLSRCLPETREGGKRINEIRRENRHDPLEVVVPHLVADDGDIISSTRIVTGEIDEHGTVIDD